MSSSYKIRSVVESINKSQTEAINKRALAGQLRSFELVWVRDNIQYHNYRIVPAFTARQRQNIRDLISRLGSAEALSLTKFSIKNWSKAIVIYSFLPPRPVFDSFYFHRDKFLAFMVDYQNKVIKSSENLEKIKSIEKTPMSKEKISLVDMFKKVKQNGSNSA